jgi:hypothetical protein
VGVNVGVRMLELSEATREGASFVKDATITVDGGAVVAMYLRTDGIAGQDAAMRALIRKFGPPLTSHVDRLQNRMGAQFAGRRATWRRPGIIVTFDSTAEGLDDGAINIMTTSYARQRSAATKEPSL